MLRKLEWLKHCEIKGGGEGGGGRRALNIDRAKIVDKALEKQIFRNLCQPIVSNPVRSPFLGKNGVVISVETCSFKIRKHGICN